MILGLDIAQSFGWGVLEDDKVRGYGTLKLPTKMPHAEKLGILQAFLETWAPPVVVIEDVQFSKFPMAAASYWRLRTLLELTLQVHHPLVAMETVGVTTLKKWATGKGNAKKEAMVRAANQRFGLDLQAKKKPHQDMADALLVAAWWREQTR